jgi:hypothetical protein
MTAKMKADAITLNFHAPYNFDAVSFIGRHATPHAPLRMIFSF